MRVLLLALEEEVVEEEDVLEIFLDLKKVSGVLLVLKAEQFEEHPNRVIKQRKNENTCAIISRLNRAVSLPISVNQ